MRCLCKRVIVLKVGTIIMSYIEKNKEKRFSASDVYNYLRELGSTTNLTTVYRNLEKMMNQVYFCNLPIQRTVVHCISIQSLKKNVRNIFIFNVANVEKSIILMRNFMGMVEKYFDNHGFTLKVGESVLVGICESCRN